MRSNQAIDISFQVTYDSAKIDTKDEEILYLRDIIHKLNSELSRCQSNIEIDNLKKGYESAANASGKSHAYLCIIFYKAIIISLHKLSKIKHITPCNFTRRENIRIK